MRRAVVLGGSFAGLLAARVLSDAADEVVIVEPDLLHDAGHGPGAPHRQQLHALLSMGRIQLERLHPGISEELTESGASLATGSGLQFYTDGQLRPAVEDVETISATRSAIESSVRRRTERIDNVRFLTARARGIRLEADRVQGVHYAKDGDEAASLEADFVVDAMGRSSRLTTWLVEQGWPAPPVDRMRVDLGYATATFSRGSELPGSVIVHSSPGPASNYLPTLCEPAAMAAVEGNRWMVVLVGYADHRPGADPKEFLARMRRCVGPIQEVADRCEMEEGSLSSFHFRESQRRRFEELDRLPGGLAVMGDALASVNPIYGQGLTLATLQASCLALHLRSGDPQLPSWGYFRRAAAVVKPAWELSTTADLAQPHVTGPYPRGYPILRWIGDRITGASVQDSVLNREYVNVIHMRQHPRALTRPQVLLRTARVLLNR
ncbi:hypothetical protein AB0G86_06525 [Streptomyces scabiei]|uniref:FAD-dependent oxidoreductase n=1 Tax=Streptomyces scabiei TaxID=1930 RepID=UPI0033F681D2